jgi:hypothetical protein
MVRAFLDSLRSGGWITAERARLAALAAIAVTIAVVAILAIAGRGSLGEPAAPFGTDFASFYAAGKAVLAGAPAAPYDPASQHAREQALLGSATPFYAWQYPPTFLLVATPLAAMPYGAALALWQAGSFLLYLRAMLAVVRATLPAGGNDDPARVTRLALILAAGYPAVFVNLGHGQNGFLSAALLAGGLALLERRPATAGILLGLLAYKPQLTPMIAVALLAGGRWRAIGGGAAAAALLALAALLLFGGETWQAFLASTGYSRRALLEAGGVDWYKLQTVFAAVRLWGGSPALAYVAAAAAALAAAGCLAWLWRSGASYPAKAALLPLAVMLAAPFALDYDLMVLAPAIAFLALAGRLTGEAPYERTVLAMLWLVPLVARLAARDLAIPAGIMVVTATFALAVRRGAAEAKRRSAAGTAGVHQSR